MFKMFKKKTAETEQGEKPEKWIPYRTIEKQVELIESFEGGNQELTIYFLDKEKKKWSLRFDPVWDFRYAVENAFLDRCYRIEQNETRSEYCSIYVVEDSEYIKYFKNQVAGTLPADDLKHFLIFDKIDTGIEILTIKEPVLRSNTLDKRDFKSYN